MSNQPALVMLLTEDRFEGHSWFAWHLMCSVVDRVEKHVIYAPRNVYGIGIYCDVLMSRGAEVRVMQGF